MEKITFIECQEPGYKARTLENAKADITIAVAEDFFTPGERLTKSAVEQAGKLYIGLPFNMIPYTVTLNYTDVDIDKGWLGSNIDRIVKLNKQIITINIAGNGIYTFHIDQSYLDTIITSALNIIMNKLNGKGVIIGLIRSGGQTGIDEAGLKAAIKLNIPALCLAPKGWLFRDHNHKDIADEQQFKARFK